MCDLIHREELLQSLAVVQHCLLGAGSVLPPLDGPHVSDLWVLQLHTHKHTFYSDLSRFASYILLLLSVPSMVNLGEIKLHIGVDYGKKTQMHKQATTYKHAQVASLPTVSVGDKAAHPASCVHMGHLCVSSPPDDSRENYRESICQTMRLLLREWRF